MGREKPLANAPSPRPMTFPHPFAGWMRFVLLATGAQAWRSGQDAHDHAQAHSYQWLGSFGNQGNGRYREELRKGLAAIGRYLTAHQLPPAPLLRLDGQYGTGAVLSDVTGFAFVTRGKEYTCSIIRWFRRGRNCLLVRPTAPRKPDGAQPL